MDAERPVNCSVFTGTRTAERTSRAPAPSAPNAACNPGQGCPVDAPEAPPLVSLGRKGTVNASGEGMGGKSRSPRKVVHVSPDEARNAHMHRALDLRLSLLGHTIELRAELTSATAHTLGVFHPPSRRQSRARVSSAGSIALGRMSCELLNMPGALKVSWR